MAILATIGQQQRQGSFQTSSYVVPADATGQLRITPQIDAADFVDPAKSLAFGLYRLDPALQAWVQVASTGWVGRAGAVLPDDQPMLFVDGVEAFRGQSVRGEVSVPTRMRVGCTVELI